MCAGPRLQTHRQKGAAAQGRAGCGLPMCFVTAPPRGWDEAVSREHFAKAPAALTAQVRACTCRPVLRAPRDTTFWASEPGSVTTSFNRWKGGSTERSSNVPRPHGKSSAGPGQLSRVHSEPACPAMPSGGLLQPEFLQTLGHARGCPVSGGAPLSSGGQSQHSS